MNCITFTRINTMKKRWFRCKKKQKKKIETYRWLPVRLEEEEQQQQTSKKLDKKEPLRKPTKDDLKEFNEWIKREETGINHKLFQKNVNFQRSSDMLKAVYTTNKKKKLKNETR